MAFSDLREFLAALEHAGELKRIAAPADPLLEIAEITDRVSKRGGPALLFENPAGYAGRPLLINQFGSRRRMAMALGVEHADEVAGRPAGQAQDAAHPRRSGCVFPAHGENRSLPGGGAARSPRRAAISRPEVLARGRRAVYHVAAGFHQASRDRPAQRRHVPPSGL